MSVILVTGLIFLLICCLNGLQKENTYLDREFMDLQALPLEKLLELKKELKKKDHTVRKTATTAMTVQEKGETNGPNAMALRRTDILESSAGSSMQTAFQMSLTVLSFLAFGGYVISLVAQNMRKPQRNDDMTALRPLKTVLVNQNRRPLRPLTGATTTVSFGRRKQSRRKFA